MVLGERDVDGTVRRRPAAPPLGAAAAALVAALLAPAGTAAQGEAAPDDGGPFPEVRRHVERLVAEEGLPSLAVGVARGGEVLWEAGFGWADREARRPATAHTMYSLASISKPITATAVLRLAEEGKVDLDAPIGRHLGRPGLRGAAGDPAEATVRRVLSHTAGLPLHYHFFWEDEDLRPPPPAETVNRYGVLVFPPGEVYQYSNLGYGLLEQLVARVSGRSYADYLKTEVFVPLGMHRTAVDTGTGPHRFAATRYERESQRPLPDYDFDHRGASAVWASVHDLLRFGMFHLGREAGGDGVLSSDRRRLMQRPAPPEPGDGGGSGYGLGWSIDPDHHGARVVSHSGGMPGVRTVLRLFPEEDLAVAVLANTSDGAVFDVADRLAAAELPSFARRLAEHREARDEEAEAGDGERDGPDDARRSVGDLAGAWAGRLITWEDTLPARLTVRSDGDAHLELDGQPEAVVNGVRFRDGVLTGRARLRVPTPDADRRRHGLLLRLRRQGAGLRGWAAALTTRSPVGFALSSYLELERESDAD